MADKRPLGVGEAPEGLDEMTDEEIDGSVASTVIRGHAFIQNPRRGHCDSESKPARASTCRGGVRRTDTSDPGSTGSAGR